MKVVYTAPNRAHHYKYASALNKAGYLKAFISGFPRISLRSKAPELKENLYHSDILQTIYLASLKAGLSTKITDWLAYQSKIEQDFSCRRFIKGSDVFLFYNGSGLNSSKYAKKNGVVSIVEAVNTHVEYQEEILQTEHKNLGLPWKPFPKYEKHRRLKEYETADYILLPSEFVKRSFIVKGFPEEKLLKVCYGFDKFTSHNQNFKFHNTKSSFTVLYVGSISVRKGVRYLIEAFQNLRHPNKKLQLVGPNVEDGSLSGVALTSDIVFSGVLKGDLLEDAYKGADVFCLPSIEDGFGLVLGEALSFGLPIITTCNTGADDIITDGKEGYIIPIKDSGAISQKLQGLADNQELLSRLQFNAHAKATKLNGWEESGKILIDTLYNVCHNNSKLSD